MTTYNLRNYLKGMIIAVILQFSVPLLPSSRFMSSLNGMATVGLSEMSRFANMLNDHKFIAGTAIATAATATVGIISNSRTRNYIAYKLLCAGLLLRRPTFYWLAYALCRLSSVLGFDINNTNSRGFTPLHDAALNGNKGAVDGLIASAALIDRRDDNLSKTPLFLASRQGNISIMKSLLVTGANPNESDLDGRSPLHIAVKKGRLEAIRVLVSAHADIFAQEWYLGWTPLHRAVEASNSDAIRLLVLLGANIHQPDIHRLTPLGLAGQKTNLIDALMVRKASVGSFLAGLYKRTGDQSPVNQLPHDIAVRIAIRAFPVVPRQNISPQCRRISGAE